MCTRHRHLKLRTEGSHTRLRELESIRFFNVTSANACGQFLANILYTIHNNTSILKNGSEFSNDMIYISDCIKHDTSLFGDFMYS